MEDCLLLRTNVEYVMEVWKLYVMWLHYMGVPNIFLVIGLMPSEPYVTLINFT